MFSYKPTMLYDLSEALLRLSKEAVELDAQDPNPKIGRSPKAQTRTLMKLAYAIERA